MPWTYATLYLVTLKFDGDPKAVLSKGKAKKIAGKTKEWQKQGYHYALTVVDVYSRFGFVIPPKDN